MLASSFVLALLLSGAIMAVSLLGGLLPNFLQFKHSANQIFMSAVAGFLIGVSLLHIIPHSIEHINEFYPGSGEQQCMILVAVGIAFMFGVMRLFGVHKHASTEDSVGQKTNRSFITWCAILVGLTIHTMVEGFTLGSSIVSSNANLTMQSSLTMAVFLGILFHKPLDALTLIGIMKTTNATSKLRNLVNVAFAMVCPLMTFLTMIVLYQFHETAEHMIGYVLSIVAGLLICLALGDLLPEARQHQHDKWWILLAFLLGLTVSFLLTMLE